MSSPVVAANHDVVTAADEVIAARDGFVCKQTSAAVWLGRHPRVTPAEVRNALISPGSSDWDNRTDPDVIKEPLVDLTF